MGEFFGDGGFGLSLFAFAGLLYLITLFAKEVLEKKTRTTAESSFNAFALLTATLQG